MTLLEHGTAGEPSRPNSGVAGTELASGPPSAPRPHSIPIPIPIPIPSPSLCAYVCTCVSVYVVCS